MPTAEDLVKIGVQVFKGKVCNSVLVMTCFEGNVFDFLEKSAEIKQAFEKDLEVLMS